MKPIMVEKSPAKILLVDDEPQILQALERVFRDRFTVLVGGSVQDAISVLNAHRDCAIVLSDFRMPDRTGLELLSYVRGALPCAARALLSGQVDLQQISHALNDGSIHKFFLKPWENDYLLVQMFEALGIHEMLKAKAHFEQLAVTDPITLVSNHRFFQDRLRKEMDIGQTLSLIIFDVDHFKTFNDRFGHPEGDRLLRAVAQHLERGVGNQGYVSRYGGEEFTVILPNHDLNQAYLVAENLRQHFEHTPFVGLTSSPAYVTMSAGVAMYPLHGTTPGALVESADRALYQAKRQGRNQIVKALGES